MKKNICKVMLLIITFLFIICTFPAFLICMHERYDMALFMNIYNKFNFSLDYEFRSARYLYNHAFAFVSIIVVIIIAVFDIIVHFKTKSSSKARLISVIYDMFFLSIVLLIFSNTFYAAWIYQY